MNKNIIVVTPNEKGELFITLYGTKYQIVIKETKKKVSKKVSDE